MHVAVLHQDPSHPLGPRLRDLLQDRLGCLVPELAAFEQAEQTLRGQRVSLLAIVLSPAPDAALRLLRKVRTHINGPVLAVGVASDSKLILRALHEGADHYLDEADLEKQLDAVLLRVQLKDETARQSSGRVIALLGASGGCGTSTLAVNLAGILARDHGGCALIDLKPGVSDLAALLDLKPAHNLADLCLNAARMDRAMFESALVRHASGVQLLAPPQLYEDIRMVTAAGVNKTLNLARDVHRFTVVDLEDCYHEEQTTVLRQADDVLLVLRLDFTSLRSGKRILASLEQAGSVGRVEVVINRHGQAKELPLSQVEEALGRKIVHLVPDDAKTINAANNAGEPAVFRTPTAKVVQSIARLARSLTPRDEAGNGTIRSAAKAVNGWLAMFHS